LAGNTGIYGFIIGINFASAMIDAGPRMVKEPLRISDGLKRSVCLASDRLRPGVNNLGRTTLWPELRTNSCLRGGTCGLICNADIYTRSLR